MSESTLGDQIQHAIAENPVILFMKGNPDQPACGFSARTVAVLQSLGRPFAAPPGIPADRAAALRKAFDTAMADPALLAEMKAKKLDVEPIRWQSIESLLKDLYATPKDVVEETRAIIAGD